MSTPVLPRPAWQWTATLPSFRAKERTFNRESTLVIKKDASTPFDSEKVVGMQFSLDHLDHVEEVGHAGVPEVPPAEVVVVDLVLHQVAGLVGEPRGLQLGPAAGVLAWHRPVSDVRRDIDSSHSEVGG